MKTRMFCGDSPKHAFACACGAEVVAVIADPKHGGVITIRQDGTHCCSKYEGDYYCLGFGGAYYFDVEGATKQARISQEYMWKQSHR